MPENPYMKDTLELVDFLAGIVADAIRAKEDDGKIDKLEFARLVTSNAMEGIAAFSGVENIVGEWAHADGETINMVSNSILLKMDTAMSPNVRLLAESAVRLIVEILVFGKAVKAVVAEKHAAKNPPRAEVLPE